MGDVERMDCICGGSGNPRLFAFTLELERFLPTVRAFTGGGGVDLVGACERGGLVTGTGVLG